MRIADIITEFGDYRAYVSHTLFQHRLFLGLESLDSALKRLRDAAIWPLVVDEAGRLAELTPTLFGLQGALVDELVQDVSIGREEMLKHHLLMVEGEESSLEAFKQSSARVIDKLAAFGGNVSSGRVEFSSTPVLLHIKKETLNSYYAKAVRYAEKELVPCLKSILSAGDRSGQAYRDLWKHTSCLLVLTRSAVVAGAVNDVAKTEYDKVREAQRCIRTIERIGSCWSPNVSEDNRKSQLAKILLAEGFDSEKLLLECAGRLAK